jgi:Tfp pilus assembly pilus retraction ATPase PilT
MARLYTITNLLEHVLRENATELHIFTGKPPFILIRQEQIAVGPDSMTNDNIADLLYNLATVDQMRELNACGDAQFLYLFHNWARFAVSASIAHSTFSVKIKNLGR